MKDEMTTLGKKLLQKHSEYLIQTQKNEFNIPDVQLKSGDLRIK